MVFREPWETTSKMFNKVGDGWLNSFYPSILSIQDRNRESLVLQVVIPGEHFLASYDLLDHLYGFLPSETNALL